MSNEVAAKSWPKNFQFAYHAGGAGAPVTIWKDVKSGAKVAWGAPVKLDDDEVEAMTDGDATDIFGIALAPGNGDADYALDNHEDGGKKIPIAVATPQNVFVGQCKGATNALNLPMTCDIDITSDQYYVDEGSTTNDQIRIIARVEEDDATDTSDPPRVYFVLDSSNQSFL